MRLGDKLLNLFSYVYIFFGAMFHDANVFRKIFKQACED
jgi:hypothetical protein